MKRNWWMGYKSRIDPLVSSSSPSSPQLRSNIVNLSPCRDKAAVDSVSGVFPIVLESPSQQLARTCRRVETRCDWSGDGHPRLPTFSREDNPWHKLLEKNLNLDSRSEIILLFISTDCYIFRKGWKFVKYIFYKEEEKIENFSKTIFERMLELNVVNEKYIWTICIIVLS